MSASDEIPITVLVTGVGGGSVGHELLQALHLAKTRYRIVATDVSSWSFGLYDAAAAHLLPPATHITYADQLARICQEEGVRVLIPGSEAELKVISLTRDRWYGLGVLPLVNNARVIDTCLDKSATMAALKGLGFDVPRSAVLLESDPEKAVDWYPCVVKPSVGGSGSRMAFIARDSAELALWAAYLRKAGHVPLAQEYVGSPEGEFTVGVLHTLSGDLFGSIAIRREILRGMSAYFQVGSDRTGASPSVLALSSGISQGRVQIAPEIQRTCEAIAQALGSTGPLNIQLRYADGKVYPFEINPRFSGSCCLRALSGFNEADLLIQHHLLGAAVQMPPYEEGIAVRALSNRFVRPHQMIR